MDLSLGETQVQLGDSVRSFLSRLPRSPMPDQAPQAAGEVWQAMAAELGLTSLLLPEDMGGFGGHGEDLLVVAEAMGEYLFDQPFIEVAVTALGLLQACEGVEVELESLAAGESIIAPVLFEADRGWDWRTIQTEAVAQADGSYQLTGHRGPVVGGAIASAFLVTAKRAGDETPSLFLVERTDAVCQPIAQLDERWAVTISFDGAKARLLLSGDAAFDAIERALDTTLAGLCAEAAGIVSRMLDETVAFTKERRQFGQPISRFQVLQHRMADMLIHAEMAKSAAVLACLSLDKDARARCQAVAAAKATVCEALRFVGQNTIQLHGGLGMSAETDITRWFKRATVLEHYLGSAGFHIDRYKNAA